MGSALLNTTTELEFGARGESALPAGRTRRRETQSTYPAAPAEELRLQVAERLAAHRNRRAAQTRPPANPAPLPAEAAASRSARIAATVAERYANTQSYRAFLAAEAERAIQQARAAAEVAAMNAQAVAAAQLRMLEAFDEHASHAAFEAGLLPDPHIELSAQHDSAAAPDHYLHAGDAARQPQPGEPNLWPELDAPDTPAPAKHLRPQRPAAAPRTSNRSSNPELRTSTLTVRLYEDAASAAHVDMEAPRHAAAHTRPYPYPERNEAEARALDDEIAFRQAPVFEEPAGPPMPLPANLIVFPRQLVASRKARPRYAEGPLREEAEAAPGDGQLRIFEVDPAQISTKPAGDSDTADTPQWTSIWLDTPEASEMDDDGPEQALASGAEFASDCNVAPLARAIPPIEAAPIARRLLAGAINAAIVFAGVLAFAATLAAMSGYRFAAQPTGTRLHALLQLAGQLPAETGLEPAQIGVIAAAAAAFLCLLYQALFFCFSVATPGMRLVRIALCTFEDENPTRPAIRRRAAATLLSACPFALGFAWAALDEDRLTWHDRMSKMYLRRY